MKVGDKVVVLACHNADGSYCVVPIGKTVTIKSIGYENRVDSASDYIIHAVDQQGYSWHLSAKEVKLLSPQHL